MPVTFESQAKMATPSTLLSTHPPLLLTTVEKFYSSSGLLREKRLRSKGPTADTINVLKRKVQAKGDIPLDQQRLVFAGESLEDGRKQSDYMIGLEGTIHSIQLRGGDVPVGMAFAKV